MAVTFAAIVASGGIVGSRTRKLAGTGGKPRSTRLIYTMSVETCGGAPLRSTSNRHGGVTVGVGVAQWQSGSHAPAALSAQD
jgi:hypothetical protein